MKFEFDITIRGAACRMKQEEIIEKKGYGVWGCCRWLRRCSY